MGPRPLSAVFATWSLRACLEHPPRNGGEGPPFPFHPPSPPSGHRPPPHRSASEQLPPPAPLVLMLFVSAPSSWPQPGSPLRGYPIIPLVQHVLPSFRAISSRRPLPLSLQRRPCSFPSLLGAGSVPRHRASEDTRAGRVLLTHLPHHFIGRETHHRSQVT